MAIGTAALILILSVYNGFDGIIASNMSDLDPDILISATEGKTFSPDSLFYSSLGSSPDVLSVCEVLEDNVFLTYSGRQAIATMKGVGAQYETTSGLGSHIVEGEFALHLGDVPLACVGANLAYENGIHPRFVDKMEIYYPRSDVPVSVSNPSKSLNTVRIRPGSLFSISADTDAELIIVPIETARELTGCAGEVSAVEIRLDQGVSAKKFIRKMELPEGLVALDRYRQHPALYKMMRYEKLAIFMILLFVVIIIAFNIFGSLSMLIIEKEKDIATLQAMGATQKMTSRIFLLEGWLISLVGLAIGLVFGIGLALLQQHFGLVKMPGNYLISAYPVILKLTDVLWTILGVAGIGLAIAAISVKSRS